MEACWLLSLLLLLVALPAPAGTSNQRPLVITPSCAARFDDCTKAVMSALDTAGAAGGGQVVLAPRANSLPWIIADQPSSHGAGLFVGAVHSHVQLVLQRGVVVQAKRGAFTGLQAPLLLIFNATNFTLSGYGATMAMWRVDYNDSTKYKSSADRHGIMVAGSSHITIEGVTVDSSGGDGLIVTWRKCAEDGSEAACYRRQLMGLYPQSRNITVRDCAFSRNRRQAMTVESAETLLVTNCVFNSTGSEGLGTDPMAGVDIEPPYRALISNVTFRDCLATGNTGCGYSVYLADYNASHGPVSIAFENCSVQGTGAVRPNAGQGQESQAGYVFGAMYPGMAGRISVQGGIIQHTRLTAISVSDTAADSIQIDIDSLEIQHVGFAPSVCDGPCRKPSFPADALVTPVSLLWRTDHPRTWPQGGMSITNLRVADDVKRPWLQVLSGTGGWRDLQIHATVENPHGCTELLQPNATAWGGQSGLQVTCSLPSPPLPSPPGGTLADDATPASHAAEMIVGDVRVQALSPTLVRIEPRGPRGFYDNTSFMVVERDWASTALPITKTNTSGITTTLTTKAYTVTIDQRGNVTGVTVATPGSGGTVLWRVGDLGSVGQHLAWPAPPNSSQPSAYAIQDHPRFYIPPWGPTPIPASAVVDAELRSTNGYDFRNDAMGDTYVFLMPHPSLETWHQGRGELLRLTGPTPLLPDFAYGTWFTYWNTYSEAMAKAEILRWKAEQLPLDIWGLDMNWRNSPTAHSMDFTPCRNTGIPTPTNCTPQDHYYDFPNCEAFPGLCGTGTGWFDWLKEQQMRTFFNDHPFPASNGTAMQTSAAEVAFRHRGLTKWLANGLTFWWFDPNWTFSIPPPGVRYGGSGDGKAFEGMSNRVWGSHVYYTTVEVYNRNNPHRSHTAPITRGLALTKYADDNMKQVPYGGSEGLVQHEHPAHHRFPVWWTGDGVNLEASMEAMVDSGVYDLKPFAHSDCGGDYRQQAGNDLLLWTAHCVFGTVLRFHGADHRPWSYGAHTEGVIRSYLQMRYRMLPTLIAAGHQATRTGFPLVARCDIYWPQHPEAKGNHQYIHLNDTLVAPIHTKDGTNALNISTRSVWIPPGRWIDAWSGATVSGPRTMNVTQPYERIPLWHRQGGMMVLASAPTLRVDEQDWSELTLEAFPHSLVGQRDGVSVTRRTVVAKESEQSDGAKTIIVMSTQRSAHNNSKQVRFEISPSTIARAWVLRVHLEPGARVVDAAVDARALQVADLKHLRPVANALTVAAFAPFGGKGTRPAPLAGDILELSLQSGTMARGVDIRIV